MCSLECAVIRGKLELRSNGLAALTKSFKLFDTDNSSSIDIDEMENVLRLFNIVLSEQETRDLFRFFGATKNEQGVEEISYRDFTAKIAEGLEC